MCCQRTGMIPCGLPRKWPADHSTEKSSTKDPADKTAKTAGMLVCGVHDDSSKDDTEEMKQVSDYYIYDFAELPGMFGY